MLGMTLRSLAVVQPFFGASLSTIIPQFLGGVLFFNLIMINWRTAGISVISLNQGLVILWALSRAPVPLGTRLAMIAIAKPASIRALCTVGYYLPSMVLAAD